MFCLYQLLQILVCTADDSYIDLDRIDTADSFKFLFLKDAQQFALECLWHFSNFIQQNGAVVCQFKFTGFPVFGRTGKSTRFVSE